jgi:integrase/recombinase XerD
VRAASQGAAADPVPSAALLRAVRTYLDHLTVERALAANTLSSYRRDLARYLEALAAAGVGDLAAVTPVQVAGHLAGLREGAGGHPPLSAASAARAISAVRGLHRFAVREGLATDDPAREITPPTPPRRLPKALGVAEIEAILGSPGNADPLALRDRALLEFLYGTGARISEAVGAAIDDVDLIDGSALLHGKGGRTRLVPIGGYAREALDGYLVRARPALAASGRGPAMLAASARGPKIFLNARGGPLSRQSAWTILRRAAQRAGLDPDRISPHTLRHSYATHLLDGGADVRVVQELLGHASVTTTQVYTLVTVDKLREVYATAHPRSGVARAGVRR